MKKKLMILMLSVLTMNVCAQVDHYSYNSETGKIEAYDHLGNFVKETVNTFVISPKQAGVATTNLYEQEQLAQQELQKNIAIQALMFDYADADYEPRQSLTKFERVKEAMYRANIFIGNHKPEVAVIGVVAVAGISALAYKKYCAYQASKKAAAAIVPTVKNDTPVVAPRCKSPKRRHRA
jgi:hypothetical protein